MSATRSLPLSIVIQIPLLAKKTNHQVKRDEYANKLFRSLHCEWILELHYIVPNQSPYADNFQRYNILLVRLFVHVYIIVRADQTDHLMLDNPLYLKSYPLHPW